MCVGHVGRFVLVGERSHRLVVALDAATLGRLEVEAERRGVTVVSLAGMVLAGHAERFGVMCVGAGDGEMPAVGEAFNDVKGAWFPYCGECLGKLESGGDKVRRFP